MSSSSGKAKASRQKFAFEDLPLETQKEIFTWIPHRNLLTLQLVSRHFHSLASAKLYSNLKFVFWHSDAPSSYSKPKTRLTDVLHTFATSEHDYAQYVKSFALQLSDREDDIPTRVVSRFHFDEDSTKLLNTTLLLMLRKANTLEAFIWDPSVELNGHVYRALCNIHTLQYFHVRLDSLDPPKPPIGPPGVPPPSQSLAQAYYPPGHPHPGPIPSLASLRSKPKPVPQSSISGKRKFSTFRGLRRLDILGIDDVGESLSEIANCVTGSSSTLKSLTLSLSQELARRARRTTASAPTMSAAANAEMDDDDDDDDDAATLPLTPAAPAPSNDADVRKERAAQESVLAILFGLEPAKAADRKVDKLLKASASSLRSVEDSNAVFMSELRKIIGQLRQSKSSTPTGIAKDKNNVLDLLEKAAEKYLQADATKKQKKALPPPPPSTSKSHSSSHNWASTVPGGSLQNFAAPGGSHSNKIEDQFQQQYSQYLANNPSALAEELEFESTIDAQMQSAYSSSSFGGNTLFADELFADLPHVPVTPSMLSNAGFHQVGSPGSSSSWIPSLNGHSTFHSSHGNKLLNPSAALPNSVIHQILQQVIQKQSPNGLTSHPPDDSSEDSETEDEREMADESSGDTKAPFFPAVESNPQDKEDAMDIDMEHPDVIESDDDFDQEVIEDSEEPPKPSTPSPPKQSTTETSSASLNLLASSPKLKSRSSTLKQPKKKAKRPKTNEETMQEYLRTTHGFHLEEFSLYLIPIKASVIARGLDLSCLQRLTLLNVGPQGGFWTLLDKVRREATPVRLKYIHTDDVSLAFLNCISNFSGLVDLFMMKRSSKEADSLTPKTTVTITDIRVLALRKHISTLKRLVVMNMNTEEDSWDMDSKALRLLTAKGSGLLELAISVSMNDYHILMQTLPGLRSLVALHIVQIRTTDHCHSVTRECRKFTIDTISHCPGLRIRYLVMLQNIVWVLGPRKSGGRGSKRVKIDVKGKGKSVAVGAGSSSSGNSKGKGKAVDVGGSGGEVGGEDMAEEDFDEIESGNLEMTSTRQLKFWEVEGIKIFEKEIRTGKL